MALVLVLLTNLLKAGLLCQKLEEVPPKVDAELVKVFMIFFQHCLQQTAEKTRACNMQYVTTKHESLPGQPSRRMGSTRCACYLRTAASETLSSKLNRLSVMRSSSGKGRCNSGTSRSPKKSRSARTDAPANGAGASPAMLFPAAEAEAFAVGSVRGGLEAHAVCRCFQARRVEVSPCGCARSCWPLANWRTRGGKGPKSPMRSCQTPELRQRSLQKLPLTRERAFRPMECSSQLCRDGFGDHYSFCHRKVRADCNLQYTRMCTAPCAMQRLCHY